MNLAALRRAFRARPDTPDCKDFTAFLEGLGDDEGSWRTLVSILERDVIPVVSRHHPTADADEIASTCLAGAFETWIPEWLAGARVLELVRGHLARERYDEALCELAQHPRCRGRRAAKARVLWTLREPYDAVRQVEGNRSARSHFIAGARARVGEAQRKQRRRSLLMARNGLEVSGLSAGGGHRTLATSFSRSLCGAELVRESGDGDAWCISALPPAQLLSQDLADRVRRMLGAIEDLGPEHARVFKLLVEGLSQRNIAAVEGRHPAAISRRVQNLRELCRRQLLG